MTRSFQIVSIFLLIVQSTTAQNLVPNPSFEDVSTQFCGIMEPYDFNLSTVYWYAPTAGSPDAYFTNISNTCYNYQPNSQYSGPIGIKGSQLPKTGVSMAGFGAFTIMGLDQREYIQIELSSPLSIGFSYIVEYYVSLADSVEFSTDKIDALLSVGAVSTSNDQVLNYSPQISYAGGFLSDVSEWILISDTILAQEAFTHLTIGNFRDDNSTNLIANPGSSGGIGTYGAYYYIDDVSVEEIRDLSTIDHNIDQRITLYPNPVNNELVAEFDGDFNSINFELYNAVGQKLFISPILSEMGKVKFNLANLENGMYMLKITENQQEKTEKIIVRHDQLIFFDGQNPLFNLTERLCWYSNGLADLNEPVLYHLSTESTIYRFTYCSAWGVSYAIRLEKNDSNYTLFLANHTETTEKKLSHFQAKKFEKKFKRSQFWDMPTRTNRRGFDGSQWIFEGIDDSEYHVVDRWSPKKRSSYRKMCAYLISLSL